MCNGLIREMNGKVRQKLIACPQLSWRADKLGAVKHVRFLIHALVLYSSLLCHSLIQHTNKQQ